jgi:Uri superfamily endonuclease
MEVKPGYYVYVGSAFGPGGVSARLRHHQRIATKPHWHIDYLRLATRFLDAWCVYCKRYEHEWAQRLIQSRSTAMPLSGFGSSDCVCATHLFYFRDPPMKPELEKLLNTALETVGCES